MLGRRPPSKTSLKLLLTDLHIKQPVFVPRHVPSAAVENMSSIWLIISSHPQTCSASLAEIGRDVPVHSPVAPLYRCKLDICFLSSRASFAAQAARGLQTAFAVIRLREVSFQLPTLVFRVHIRSDLDKFNVFPSLLALRNGSTGPRSTTELLDSDLDNNATEFSDYFADPCQSKPLESGSQTSA